MKKLLLILIVTVVFAACSNDPRAKLPTIGNFGAAVLTDSLKTVSDVISLLQTQTEANVNVTGIIEKYCKGEGCWLTLENKGGEALFIEVENKAFMLPRNIEGKVATVTGKAIKEIKDGKSEMKILATAINIQ
ncbi:MAG: DUF4920 domain-containing protein [Bacteroidia bacterium]